MQKSLENALKKMNDVEFVELSKRLSIARKMRNLKFEFKLDDEDFAERFKVQLPEIKNLLNGVGTFDVKLIASIDVFERELIEKDDEADFFEEEEQEEEQDDGQDEEE